MKDIHEKNPHRYILKSLGISIVSKCACCEEGIEENMYHLFLTTLVAQKLRRYFVSFTGYRVEGRNLFTVIED